jgi:hypothetical protein
MDSVNDNTEEIPIPPFPSLVVVGLDCALLCHSIVLCCCGGVYFESYSNMMLVYMAAVVVNLPAMYQDKAINDND